MNDRKSNVHVARPRQDKVYVNGQTPEDKVRFAEKFKEQKAYEQKVKDERFAKIQERRKNKPGSGGGKGINIEVTSDN